jgi:hypothetical protein
MARTWEMSPAARDLRRCRQSMLGPAAPSLPGPSTLDRMGLGLLLRAADPIGQLGDPHYLRKANAFYYGFEEIGMNRQLGYTSPADLTSLYPQFYWNSVSAHI